MHKNDIKLELKIERASLGEIRRLQGVEKLLFPLLSSTYSNMSLLDLTPSQKRVFQKDKRTFAGGLARASKRLLGAASDSRKVSKFSKSICSSLRKFRGGSGKHFLTIGEKKIMVASEALGNHLTELAARLDRARHDLQEGLIEDARYKSGRTLEEVGQIIENIKSLYALERRLEAAMEAERQETEDSK